MANQKLRLPTNVAGDFYVDETCIDCATCRWMAPEVFDQAEGASRVHAQPGSPEAAHRALKALLACPTGSIGTVEKHDLGPVKAAFPDPIDGGVHHCGYHSESSFGAASYLIVREAGNVLVDSPRYTGPLVERIDALGGVKTLFLTHKDDVADYRRFRARYGCEVILHRADAGRLKDIDRKLDGEDPIALDDELLMIPVPGHTRGSVCLLYREEFLFGGDHVAWSPIMDHIYAFRRACWYDWKQVVRSMHRLAEHRFEWILPGHGWPCHFEGVRMRAEMQRCLEWLATQR